MYRAHIEIEHTSWTEFFCVSLSLYLSRVYCVSLSSPLNLCISFLLLGPNTCFRTLLFTEIARVHNPIDHRARGHCRVGSTEGWLHPLSAEFSATSQINHLALTIMNTPHYEFCLPCEDETYWDAVSSYAGAHNREGAQSPEHRRPDEATPKSSNFQNIE